MTGQSDTPLGFCEFCGAKRVIPGQRYCKLCGSELRQTSEATPGPVPAMAAAATRAAPEAPERSAMPVAQGAPEAPVASETAGRCPRSLRSRRLQLSPSRLHRCRLRRLLYRRRQRPRSTMYNPRSTARLPAPATPRSGPAASRRPSSPDWASSGSSWSWARALCSSHRAAPMPHRRPLRSRSPRRPWRLRRRLSPHLRRRPRFPALP